MSNSLVVCELFRSIQGESTRAGLPCIFIRLSGCNLSCSYCDTSYAGNGGTKMSIDELCLQVSSYAGTLVEITGGEPLFQHATPDLCTALIRKGYTVLVETNGSFPIDTLPLQCVRIVDVKCPSSGMSDSFLLDNLSQLRANDELKFVIGSREDFKWTQTFITSHRLCGILPLLIAPVTGTVTPAECAEWILASDLPLRIQLQQHKIIWGNKPGV